MEKQISIAFSAVFGVVPGYGHDNGLPEGATADALVAHAWRESLEAEFASSGILVGATVVPGRVVYPASFGCPADGEVVAVASGNSNPKFVAPEDLEAFRDAVIRVAEATKTRLGQSRVQLTFSEVSGFVYFEPADSGGVQRWGV
jgi:hypothetical protein